MRIEREEFLKYLEWMQAGTNKNDVIEQSGSYVFKDGMIYTFNDEVACKMPSGLHKSFEGAIAAEPLLEVMRKLEEEVVDLEVTENKLLIKAKKQKTTVTINRDQEINLPINYFEEPSSWSSLDEDFPEAISLVQHCAGKDEAEFAYTCVHIHPKWIEACDKFHFCRWKLNSKISKSSFVRRESIKHIVSLGMKEIGESDTWVHFRNSKKMILSCRKYEESEYPDITEIFNLDGSKIALPKKLSKTIALAEVFSKENVDANLLHVDLKPGKLRLRSIGLRGSLTKIQNISYDGESFSFVIPPQMFTYVIEKFNDCVVGDGRLKVDGGSYQYVTRLMAMEDQDNKESSDE